MEEKSPTMPSVVLLKHVKVTGSSSDNQGKFEYAEYNERKNAQCPHCGGVELYAHGYYYRMFRAEGRDGVHKRIRIKVKRYKPLIECGYIVV